MRRSLPNTNKRDGRAYLHILNGDFSRDLWEKAGFSGGSLVWRETYLEGPLPETDDLSVFRTARAGYLASFDELTGIGAERLYRHLQKMDDAVLTLPPDAALMLWFDSCIFDQTILMRILYLLGRRQNGMPEVFLYCCKGNCLEEQDFQQGFDQKIRLLSHDLAVAGKAWEYFLKHDAAGMRALAAQADFARLPAMAAALLRCADEVPDQDGLSRTQRQILQIAAGGRRSFLEIFSGLDAFEEFPFLGDTACRRLLDQLVGRGLLKSVEGGYELP